MNAEDILNELEDDYRPARVRELRADIERETGMTVPRSLPRVDRWLSTHRSALTKKLREAAGRYD